MLTPPFIHDHGDSFELPLRKHIEFTGAIRTRVGDSSPAFALSGLQPGRGSISPFYPSRSGRVPLLLSELISDPFYDSCRQDADWDRPGAGLSGGDAGANCNFHGGRNGT